MDDFVAPLVEGGVTMTLTSLITDAGSVISAVGDNYATLAEDFGVFLFVPIILVMVKAIIGQVKSILFFRRGRRGRG